MQPVDRLSSEESCLLRFVFGSSLGIVPSSCGRKRHAMRKRVARAFAWSSPSSKSNAAAATGSAAGLWKAAR